LNQCTLVTAKLVEQLARKRIARRLREQRRELASLRNPQSTNGAAKPSADNARHT